MWCVFSFFFFSSRRRHTRLSCDWSSDVCSSDRSEEHTSELQSHDNLVCRLLGVQTCALPIRSEEHTSELQSHDNLVCRLLGATALCRRTMCPAHLVLLCSSFLFIFFFFNDTAPTEIYPLSLHDALPIYGQHAGPVSSRLDRRRAAVPRHDDGRPPDRKSTRLNSSHTIISYAVFCLKKKNECRRPCTRPPTRRRRSPATRT